MHTYPSTDASNAKPADTSLQPASAGVGTASLPPSAAEPAVLTDEPESAPTAVDSLGVNDAGDSGGPGPDSLGVGPAAGLGSHSDSGPPPAAARSVAAGGTVAGGMAITTGAAASSSSATGMATTASVAETAAASAAGTVPASASPDDPTPEQLQLLESTLLERDLALVFAMDECVASRPAKFAIKLAKAMVCVFEEQGSCMRLVRKTIQFEVNKTSSSASLSSAVFLDDLLTTEIVVAHANHMAHMALADWLASFAEQLAEAGPIELDPAKVSKAEAATAATKAMELAMAFIQSATQVAAEWSPSLRHVFKFVHSAVGPANRAEEVGRIVFDRVLFVNLLNTERVKSNKMLKNSVKVLAKVVKTTYRHKPLSYPSPASVAKAVATWADNTRPATEAFLALLVDVSDDSIVEVVRQVDDERKRLHLINAYRILADMQPDMTGKYSDDFRGKFNLREFNRHAQLLLKVKKIMGQE
ncbi:uncharacterized protein AMSG_00742 [Thecamonas trahens ATCC 50062]|uniref:Uncharacterized protein n=1 Tax=Thecamonas trahens ATCC 50062 TaxID=461836 RepID=A0A0L0DE42_THETB|nr:hypothetical protein AMSG_00742 [Thecamonas trahens ATCC 50062]KNC50582.1 hypothetical protein AMSG_00742 [Thecamonas trahens ATCC 50062]|eukprot:XP_013762471.1 hypothetical protein AMSG_00742 [Thecamonas trahens ATCC 50062]